MRRAARIEDRALPEAAYRRLLAAGVAPVLARLFAARGIDDAAQLSHDLARLLPPEPMKDLAHAARLLADAIERGQRICVVADYDCDGATACAVAMRGLRLLGARADRIDYLVPNRFEHGYGLSVAVAELAAHHPRLGRPDWLITVDSGVASVDGVAAAKAAGIGVIVTDHHLPGSALPPADAIVDPNQHGCGFGSRNLAGVGVMFYLLVATRAEFRRRDRDGVGAHAALQSLLDLVALGTIADLVPLDANNRLLVAAGLRRIRAGRANAGIRALLRAAGRDERRISAADLGFAVGPRINAAGRLADISLGIECLLAGDDTRADELARALDAMNRERRQIEQSMREQALDTLPDAAATGNAQVLFGEGWHEGVIGLVASRVKDRLHRPVVALARASADASLLRGSGRSIPGVHLRDALDWIDKQAPGMLLRFGGHAMAAGLTMHADRLAEFAALFEQAVEAFADPGCFTATCMTDGTLAPDEIGPALVARLDTEVWGQCFPAPLFSGEFAVARQSIVGEKHLKVELRTASGQRLDAIAFGSIDPLPAQVRIAYRLVRDDWRGQSRARLVIEAVEAAHAPV